VTLTTLPFNALPSASKVTRIKLAAAKPAVSTLAKIAPITGSAKGDITIATTPYVNSNAQHMKSQKRKAKKRPVMHAVITGHVNRR
jgi:hypothetical protein